MRSQDKKSVETSMLSLSSDEEGSLEIEKIDEETIKI
jgi:hypothetical protein